MPAALIQPAAHRRGGGLHTGPFELRHRVVDHVGRSGQGDSSRHRSGSASSGAAGQATQARALALAGLEDARTKLDKDYQFPPVVTEAQKSFSYTENVLDRDGSLVGSYTVTLDLSLRGAPFALLRLISVGTAGPMDNPGSRRKFYAELDMSRRLRSDPTLLNPDFFQFVTRQDLGAY